MKSTSYSPTHLRLRTTTLSIIKTAYEVSELEIFKNQYINAISEEKLERLNKLASERPFSNRHRPKKHDPL